MKGHVGEHVGVANEWSYQRDRFFSWELQRETEMSKMPAYAIRNSKNFQGNHKPLLARNLQEARAESRPKLIKTEIFKMMALHDSENCSTTKFAFLFPVVRFILVSDQTLAEQLYRDKRLLLALSLPRVINFNFLFQSLTRDISYSMENLAMDSLLRWKLIEQSFLTTSLNHFLLEWLG